MALNLNGWQTRSNLRRMLRARLAPGLFFLFSRTPRGFIDFCEIAIFDYAETFGLYPFAGRR